MITKKENLKDGVSCGHSGCLSHVTHPCEKCGRVKGQSIKQEVKIDFVPMDNLEKFMKERK